MREAMELAYVTRSLEDIHPYANNPRNNDEAVDDVAESIRQCGYIAPIVVDEDGVILAGHTRYRALTKLGMKECPVIIAKGLTEEQERKYRLYDNKTAELASWDQRKLAEELSDVDFEGYDFGQPAGDGKDGPGPSGEKVTKTCPCCGEVFEA